MANSFLQEKLLSLKTRKCKQKTGLDSNGETVAEVAVDPSTHTPTKAWEKLKEVHAKRQLDPNTCLHSRRRDNALRFVCLSDTHGAAEQTRREYHRRVPEGDVLIHCGDFTMKGDPSEISAFNSFVGRLPHPVKLVIAGNHEVTFEDASYGTHPVLVRKQLGLPMKASSREVVVGCKALLQNILYLEDESIDICGIKLYGTPWVPAFGSWGFSVTRGEHLLQKWNQIPDDTDILITHGPPCGYGDHLLNDTHHAGCVELLNTVVKRVKPKFHVFGHIHSGYGMWTNGKTTFINAATCSNTYKPDHDPIVFDFPLPCGYSREDFAQLSTESLRQARESAREPGRHQAGCSSARQRPQASRESVPATGVSGVSGHQPGTGNREADSGVADGCVAIDRSRADRNPVQRNNERDHERSDCAAEIKRINRRITEL